MPDQTDRPVPVESTTDGQEELTELPDREAMSLVNANLAIPVNLGLAANVLSDGATAGAIAQQQTPIDQGVLNGQ